MNDTNSIPPEQEFYNDGSINAPSPPTNISYPSESRSISLVTELSPRKYIRDVIHELKGEIWDDSSQKYIKIDEDMGPIMNSRGRMMFFQLITAGVNEITTFSNYRDDIRLIYKIVKKFVFQDAVPIFFYYRSDYEIKDKQDVYAILNKLQGVIVSAYFKALGSGDRRAVTANITESISSFSRTGEQTNQKEAGKKGGIFNFVRGGK